MQTPRGQAPRGYATLDWRNLACHATNRRPSAKHGRAKRETTARERNRSRASALDASTAAWRASLRDEYRKLDAVLNPPKPKRTARQSPARASMVAREQAHADALIARALPALAYKPGFAG